MNFAIIILGAGALLLIATTMGRKEPTDPGVEDEEAFLAGLQPGEIDYWTFAPDVAQIRPPTVPAVPGLPAWQTSQEALEAFADEGI